MTSTISTTTTSRAVIDGFGGPELFRDDERPLSGPAAGQVQVRVGAVSVNPVDLTTRAGKNIPGDAAQFPMVVGWDAAGTVEQVGDGVSGWQVGDRVAAMTFQPIDQNGTYTQLINLAADLLAPLPDGLALEQAATLPLAGLTASQIVQWVDLPAGASLLVDGPVGAVGRLVVQLAARRGIRVVAVAKPADRDHALELGAAEVVDRGDFTAAVRQLHPGGVDAAIDLVGGATAHATLASVRDGGAYATVVPPYVDPTGPFDPRRGIRHEVLTVHPDTPELTNLLATLRRGELTSPVERTYPLAQAGEAHRRQQQGGLRGKLVLLP
jgi:NADPH2:quinone reductase